jgi:hypothetical protein
VWRSTATWPAEAKATKSSITTGTCRYLLIPGIDLASFRLFTSQLIVQGSATQGHVAKAFGVPLVAIKRSTKLYGQRGAAGFFVPKARREGSQLNAEKLEQARALLLQGHSLAVVSRETGVLTDTLRKAIAAGRLPAVKKKTKR